ncbi:MAG TPA: major capsid protein [Planctomycetota bacterium]|mgnify:CR=1 FL=1|nr:major capsid protein [Planctomycetota bacterium]HQB00696.1 major capsid protein [Planctomycetota bacterium]
MEIIDLVKKLYKPNTFIRNLFFKKEVYESSECITWNIINRANNIASFGNPNSSAHVVNIKNFTPPVIIPRTREKILIPIEYNNVDDNILQSTLKYLLDRIVWTQEYLCSLAFTEGKIDIQNENISLNVDFKIPVENVQEASVEWQSETANIIEDIEKLTMNVRKVSGLVPDSLIIGYEAFSYMMRNEKFRKIYNDQRKFEMWSNRLQERPEGASCHINLPYAGGYLALYQYTKTIIDDNEIEKYLIDPKKIYIGSTQAQNTFTWGRVTDIHGGDSKIFTKTWENFSGIYLLAESCSMPVLSQPNAFGRMTVIAE